MRRRHLLAGLALLPMPALAQERWPSRPVRMISSAPPAGEASAPAPASATATRLAVLRHLVPLDYTRGTRYRRDIGLPAAPLTHLAVATELDRYPPEALGFALMTLTRGQNHVVAALEAAAEAIAA